MEGDFQTRIEVQLNKLSGSESDMNDYLLNCLPILRDHAYDVTQHDDDQNTNDQAIINSLFKTNTTTKKKPGMFLKRYLKEVEGRSQETMVFLPDYNPGCKHCNSSNLEFVSKHSDLVCMDCGAAEFAFEESSDGPSYKELQDHEPLQYNYSYKRENHFNEWINQFQGQEETNIPEEIFDQLRYEFKKQRLSNLKDITHAKVRSLLKKLRLHKYYEHVPYITVTLNGIVPPRMTIELETKLRQMFLDIQEPFNKHCPADRKNFLSYSYVLYKFCELLDQDDFLPCFPLLKSKDKLIQQDRIWKGICSELKWEYIPTI